MDAAAVFDHLQISHIDQAIAKELGGRFPGDVAELARIFLYTLALVEQSADRGQSSVPTGEKELGALIEQRLEAILIVEERRLDEDESSHSDGDGRRSNLN